MEKRLRLCATLVALFINPLGKLHAKMQINVCPQCDVSSIQQAVRLASPGASITIAPGTYLEHDITIEKPLTLRGEPKKGAPVIVDGEGTGNVLLIHAPDVRISRLTVRNSGLDYTEDLAGIKVMDSKRCLLEDNLLEENSYGIYLGNTQACQIRGNRVRGTKRSETASGDGIHIWHGSDTLVEHNVVSHNRDGIYLEFVKDSKIKVNQSLDNTRYGLHFMFSNHNEFDHNVFSGNLSGVAVMYSRHTKITHNVFEKSLGPAAYGLLLKDISDSVLADNDFRHNTFGTYLEGTTRSRFMRNRFLANGWAMRVLGDTDSNIFTRNDYLANTFDVSTNASKNMNVFIENHWSRYKGLDLDKDGHGDDPYQVVQLSSLLMEQYSASVLLIHSFFFSLLDQVESALPAFVPETYQDRQPLMIQATAL